MILYSFAQLCMSFPQPAKLLKVFIANVCVCVLEHVFIT